MKIICSVTDRKPFVACGFFGVMISSVIGYITFQTYFRCSRQYDHRCNVNTLPHVLHRFAARRFVDMFVEVLEFVFGSLLKFCVHPAPSNTLVTLQHPVDLSEFQPLVKIKLLISVVHDIVFLVTEHQDKLGVVQL